MVAGGVLRGNAGTGGLGWAQGLGSALSWAPEQGQAWVWCLIAAATAEPCPSLLLPPWVSLCCQERPLDQDISAPDPSGREPHPVLGASGGNPGPQSLTPLLGKPLPAAAATLGHRTGQAGAGGTPNNPHSPSPLSSLLPELPDPAVSCRCFGVFCSTLTPNPASPSSSRCSHTRAKGGIARVGKGGYWDSLCLCRCLFFSLYIPVRNSHSFAQTFP